MKLHFSIKNYQIQISNNVHYEVCIFPDDAKAKLREVTDAPVFHHSSYLGAYLQGWQLARLYAKEEGRNQCFMVDRITDLGHSHRRTWMCCRTIQVTKQVAFFSK